MYFVLWLSACGSPKNIIEWYDFQCQIREENRGSKKQKSTDLTCAFQFQLVARIGSIPNWCLIGRR